MRLCFSSGVLSFLLPEENAVSWSDGSYFVWQNCSLGARLKSRCSLITVTEKCKGNERHREG